MVYYFLKKSAIIKELQFLQLNTQGRYFMGIATEKINYKNLEITVEYANETERKLSDSELAAYVDRAYAKYTKDALLGLYLTIDGDDVAINYNLAPVPFERVRRITGYLVGTMDRWNNAKTAEESQRVKHGIAKSASNEKLSA